MQAYKKDFPCPVCQSLKRVSTEINVILKNAGKLAKIQEEFGYIQAVAIPLVSPATAVLTLTTLHVYEDICADCGHKHISRVELKELPISSQKMPGQPNMPPRN